MSSCANQLARAPATLVPAPHTASNDQQHRASCLPLLGTCRGFTDACSIYSASGYSITTSDGITIKSVTLGHCNSYTAGSFKLRFTAPDGAVTDVAITGMPVEEIGTFSYNVPGWGFSVPPDAEGYTLQLVGAPFDAAAAYLRALSTQQVGFELAVEPGSCWADRW